MGHLEVFDIQGKATSSTDLLVKAWLEWLFLIIKDTHEKQP